MYPCEHLKEKWLPKVIVGKSMCWDTRGIFCSTEANKPFKREVYTGVDALVDFEETLRKGDAINPESSWNEPKADSRPFHPSTAARAASLSNWRNLISFHSFPNNVSWSRFGWKSYQIFRGNLQSALQWALEKIEESFFKNMKKSWWTFKVTDYSVWNKFLEKSWVNLQGVPYRSVIIKTRFWRTFV